MNAHLANALHRWRPVGVAVTSVLASVRFAVGLIIVIAGACVLGTILPQGQAAIDYVQKFPAATGRMEFLDLLGLTRIFSAWWFLALLCLLAATVVACSTRRLSTVLRAAGFARRRAFGSFLTHLSILLILAGAVVRGAWGDKGFIELREGETRSDFVGAKGARPLPFAISLKDFQIETDPVVGIVEEKAGCCSSQTQDELLVQWPERSLEVRLPATPNLPHALTPPNESASTENTFHITVLRYEPDFAMNTTTREVASRSREPNNPAILVAVTGPGYENHAWLFAKFPDFALRSESKGGPSPLRLVFQAGDAPKPAAPVGPVRNYKSEVTLSESGKAAVAATIAVNQPLKFKGYSFYQTGFNPDDLSWTSLEVVRDPGVSLVYSGFLFLIAGLFVVFYLNPWLASRKAQQGV